MNENRTPEAAIRFRDVPKLFTLFGAAVAGIIGRRGDEREKKKAEHRRFDYRCPCNFCGEDFDTPEAAWFCAALHYGKRTREAIERGSELSTRNNANLAAHWFWKAVGERE